MDIKELPHDLPLARGFHKMTVIIRNQMREQIEREEWLPKDFKLPCVSMIQGIGLMSPVSQKELSIWMGADPSDVVSMIDTLEKNIFVTRTRDVNDRRKQLLSLTKKGEEARKKLMTIGAKVVKSTFTPLSNDELKTLKTLLDRVIHYNDEEIKKGKNDNK